MYLMDGEQRIMISDALNESDRLSSCSKRVRKSMKAMETPFNVYAFQTVPDVDVEDSPDDFILKYNLNGIPHQRGRVPEAEAGNLAGTFSARFTQGVGGRRVSSVERPGPGGQRYLSQDRRARKPYAPDRSPQFLDPTLDRAVVLRSLLQLGNRRQARRQSCSWEVAREAWTPLRQAQGRLSPALPAITAERGCAHGHCSQLTSSAVRVPIVVRVYRLVPGTPLPPSSQNLENTRFIL